jgi:hypothetical protein
LEWRLEPEAFTGDEVRRGRSPAPGATGAAAKVMRITDGMLFFCFLSGKRRSRSKVFLQLFAAGANIDGAFGIVGELTA